MLERVRCVRRRPDLTVVEFRRHGLEYGEAIVAPGAEIGAVRIEVSASLAVEANLEWQARRGSLFRPAEPPLFRRLHRDEAAVVGPVPAGDRAVVDDGVREETLAARNAEDPHVARP